MSRRNVSVVIVCEDTQQSAFARRYLEKRGYESRRIRIIPNPGGEGSGEQFVRQTLIQEVKSYRKKEQLWTWRYCVSRNDRCG